MNFRDFITSDELDEISDDFRTALTEIVRHAQKRLTDSPNPKTLILILIRLYHWRAMMLQKTFKSFGRCLIVGATLLSPYWVTTAVAQRAVPWSNDDLAIGIGFDTLRNQVRGSCLNLATGTPRTVSGERVEFELRDVRDESSLYRKLGISAEAKYGAVSGNASLDSEVEINRFSAFFYISARVDVRTESLSDTGFQDPVISNEDLELLPKDLQRFRERCGDTYVSARRVGGDYTALVEVETRSESDKRDVQAAIGGSSGIFSAEAKAREVVKTLTQNRRINIRVIRGGGDGSPIVISTDELVAAVTNYPTYVKSLESNKLRPYTATLQDYTALHVPSGVLRSQFDDLPRRIYIEEADGIVTKLRSKVANVRYAIAYKDQFPAFDIAAAAVFVDEASSIMKVITNKARICISQSESCGTFDSPLIPSFELPERLGGLTREELVANAARSNSVIQEIIFSNDYRDRLCLTTNGLHPVIGSPFGSFNALNACVYVIDTLRKQCEERGCRP